MSWKNGKPKVPDQYNDYLMAQAFKVFTSVNIYRINISEQNWIFDFFRILPPGWPFMVRVLSLESVVCLDFDWGIRFLSKEREEV